MDRAQYLLVMAACVLLTLPLEFVFAARVYRRPRRLLRGLAGPFLLFWAVDAVAIARDLWAYSPRFTTGWEVPVDVPVEELVFFAVVPLCALLTFEAASNVFAGRGPSRRVASSLPSMAAVLGLAIVGSAVLTRWLADRVGTGGDQLDAGSAFGRGQTNPNTLREYTVLAVALVVLVAALEWWWRTGLLGTRAYWSTMPICIGFMISVNGWFTKLSAPIVSYAPAEFSGWRPVWDIPAEDYLFGVALLTLVLLCWVRAGRHPEAATP